MLIFAAMWLSEVWPSPREEKHQVMKSVDDSY